MSILPEEGALFGSLRLCNRLYYHFLNSLVQSLCSKKFFHKIVSSDVLHTQGTSALGCSTLLLPKNGKYASPLNIAIRCDEFVLENDYLIRKTLL